MVILDLVFTVSRTGPDFATYVTAVIKALEP